MSMKSKRPELPQVNQYQTQASHPVITCFWAQLVQHPWLAMSTLVLPREGTFRDLPGAEPRRKQTRTLCKIDSGTETNIIPN